MICTRCFFRSLVSGKVAILVAVVKVAYFLEDVSGKVAPILEGVDVVVAVLLVVVIKVDSTSDAIVIVAS